MPITSRSEFWYVEQYIKSTCLWVYVKGSSGSLEKAKHIVELLAANGIRARVRMKR